MSVEAPEEKRPGWAVARGTDPPSAKARLAALGDGAQRRERADRILPTTGRWKIYGRRQREGYLRHPVRPDEVGDWEDEQVWVRNRVSRRGHEVTSTIRWSRRHGCWTETGP